MTAPNVPIVSTFPAPPPTLSAVKFPLGWLLQHASPPIQYRATIDVAKLGSRLSPEFSYLPYTFKPALELALAQSGDGVWNGSMLTAPSPRSEGFDDVGTVHAVRRMLEYGWDKDSPPIYQARRILFRLLAEDDDPELLFEFAPNPNAKTKPEEEMLLMARQTLREAAGAALAQAGFEADPRLRGAARRTLDRMMEFLKSPVGAKPWIRIGNRQVLSPDAFAPSIYALQMLAHMPLFRSEHYEGMELLYRWLTRPLPRQEQMQVVGKKIVPVPLLVMGDRLPHRNAVEDDVPAALGWIELMARMGFLRRNENWSKMYERFVDDCGRDGVWHPHKGLAMPRSSNPWVWSAYPLEPSRAGDERWADMTFRIGLIARLSGRPIDLI
ncbi:MAG TPA: hypothetical protein VGQ30_05510 [Gemmatimonadaceae bacterium]|nr:hypothetical protein [Gemmatimonadaceae bacterium]